jgi:hypothetical protein
MRRVYWFTGVYARTFAADTQADCESSQKPFEHRDVLSDLRLFYRFG